MYALVILFQKRANQVFCLLSSPNFFFLVEFWAWMFKLYTGRWIGTSNELSTSNLNSKQEHKEMSELLKIVSVLLGPYRGENQG